VCTAPTRKPPADVRTLAGSSSLRTITNNERKPGWFPLIARAAPPQALLSFRYAVGIYLNVTPLDEQERFMNAG
jgi:hypothetical protein